MNPSTFSFSIAERGETTGQNFNWSFTAKQFLSQRDRINKDNVRRNLLGNTPGEVSNDAAVRTEMLSHLKISLVETPKDWRDASDGLDLYDDNILFKVYECVIEGQNKAIEDAVKAGDEAKEKLRKVVRGKGQKDEGTSGGAA